jgi:hypothetical protein
MGTSNQLRAWFRSRTRWISSGVNGLPVSVIDPGHLHQHFTVEFDQFSRMIQGVR